MRNQGIIKYLMTFSAAAVLLLASAAYANDPPHVSGIATCTDCHNSGNMSTPSYGNIDNTPYNYMCWDCHVDASSGVHDTHSSKVTKSESKYGLWTYECRDCHNPHYQRQFRLNIDQDYPAGSRLFTGKIGAISNCCGGTGIKNIVTLLNPDGSAIAPGTWATNKWKDFIIKPNTDEQYYYLIANSTDNGVINTTTEVKETYTYYGYTFTLVQPNDPFALGYGKLVSEEIATKKVVINASDPLNPLDPNTFRDVFLFNTTGAKSGGYSQTETTAVCIVCHTKTKVTNYGFAKFEDNYQITATMRADGVTWTNTQYGTSGQDSTAENTHYSRVTTAAECFDNGDASCHKGHEDGYSQGGADCGKCHGKDSMSSTDNLIKFIMVGGEYIGNATGEAGVTTNTWGHNRHEDVGLVCKNCHLTGMVPESTATDVGTERLLDLDFSLDASTHTAGTYNGRAFLNGYTYNGPSNWNTTTAPSLGDGTMMCDNLYCHSDGGNYDLSTYVYQTPAWDDPTSDPLKCNICHGDSAASPVELKDYALTTLHPKHTSDYPYDCYECHASVVNSSIVIVTQSLHVNDSKQVSFRAGGVTQGGTWNKPDCDNTYCHSDALGNPPKTTAQWGDTGSLSCGGCHNNLNDGIANTWSAPHTEHLDYYNGRFTCNACHSEVSNDTGDGILDTTMHVNAQKNVDINTTNYGPVAYYNTANSDYKCYNVECHSTGVRFDEGIKNMPTDWVGGKGCDFCHEKAEAKSAMNAAKASGTALSNTHIVHVANGTTGEYGDPARGSTAVTCDNCHKGTTDDGLTINPAGYAVNHVDFEKDVVFSVSDFNGSSTDSWTGDATKRCDNTYCHGNFMPYGSGAAGAGGVYVDNSPTWDDQEYISSSNVKERCGKCHAFPPTGYTGRGGSTTTHDGYVDSNDVGDCVGCHQHLQGTSPYFKTSGPDNITMHINGFVEALNCGGCHGIPPMDGTQLVQGSSPITGRGNNYSASPGAGSGAHALHNAVGFGNGKCNLCHSGTGSDHNKSFYNALTFGFTHNQQTQGTYNAPLFSDNDYIAVSGDAGTTVNNGPEAAGQPRKCYNIYCHSDGGNYGGSTYIYQVPEWDATPNSNCNICHGNPGGEDVVTLPHPTHVSTYTYDCRECHALTVDATPDVIDDDLHVDGIKNVAFYTGGGSIVGGGDYNQPQCDNTYCHSPGNKDTGYDAPVTTATWNGGMPADCTGCHGGDSTVTPVANIITADAHNAHINSPSAVGRNIGCKECHRATVDANQSVYNAATHVNRLLNVKFESSLNDGSPLYNGLDALSADGAVAPPDTGASCESLYCHSNGNTNGGATPVYNAAIAWDTAQIGCDGCHGGSGKPHNHPDVDGPAAAAANDHVKHVESSGITCDKCHLMTTSESATNPTTVVENEYHLNGIENVTFLTIGSKSGNYNPSLRRCSATYCHGSDTPDWGGASIACDGCHDATNSGGLSLRHDVHYNNSVAVTSLDATNGHRDGGYGFGCGNCHPDASEQIHTMGPANSTIFQDADINGTNLTLGNYTPDQVNNNVDGRLYNYTEGGTCTTYCHSTGEPPGPTAIVYIDTVAWNDTSTGNCDVCHDDSTTPINTNVHLAHINGTTYGYACEECHAGTVSGSSTIDTAAKRNLHLDGSNDVIWNSGVNQGGTAYSSPDCSGIYCHSKGIDRTAPFYNGPVTAAAWTGSALGCGACHEGGTTTGPPYTNGDPKANSHDAHVVDSGQACADCHNSVVDDGNNIINYSNHVNGDYDVVNATYIGGFTPPAAMEGGTCTNISCHSGNNAQWGATNLSCADCHLDSTAPIADLDDFTWNDTPSAISNTEWIGAGHGRPTASGDYQVSGRPAANFTGTDQCLYCHDGGVSHRQSNIFRLRNIVNATWGINWNCQVCHSLDGPGVTLSSTIDAAETNTITAFHNGPDHQAGGNNGGRLCWDCHDPHGDSNIYMVQTRPFMKSDVTNGIMIYNATEDAVFVTNADAYGYVNGTNFDGICQVCHTRSDGQLTHFVHDDSANFDADIGSGHANSGACYTCHDHNNADKFKAFEPGGGSDCSSSACHMDFTDDLDNFAVGGDKAFINQTEWENYGHGNTLLVAKAGTGVVCWWCHNKDLAGHPSDVWSTANPFRLWGEDFDGQGWNGACLVCHDSGASNAAYQPDTSLEYTLDTSPGGDIANKVNKWHYMSNHGSGNADNADGGRFCWDCHDPHGDDQNIKMIQRKPAKDNDGTGGYGIPDTSDWASTNSVVFTDDSVGVGTGGFARAADPWDEGICNWCHTGKASDPNKMEHYYRDGTDAKGDGEHNAAALCTGCHQHSKDTANDGEAFRGAGESSGGQNCKDCHEDLFSTDQSQATMHGNAVKINYKHYMNNAGTDDLGGFTAGSGAATVYYPMDNDLNIAGVTNTTGETGRRCLMCHVDHDIFRQDINAENIYIQGGFGNTRAGNMRTSINDPVTNTTGYNNTDFDVTNPDGGICLSCHFKTRYKYLITPNDATATPPIPFPLPGTDAAKLANAVEILKHSTHSYQVEGGMYNGNSPTPGDASRFKAVCLKCHNDSIGTNFGPKSTWKAQQTEGACYDSDGAIPSATDPRQCAESKGFWNGTPAFARHISSNDSSLAVMGTLFEQGIVNGAGSPTDAYTLWRDPDLPAWTAEQWVGYQVVVTKGTGQNSRSLVIVQNDPDKLTVSSNEPFAATLDGTSHYDIVKSPMPQDDLCFSCHSKKTQNKTTDTLKDWYAQESMKEIIVRMKDVFVGDQGSTNADRLNNSNAGDINVCTKKKNADINGGEVDFFKGYTFRSGSSKTEITSSTAIFAPDVTNCPSATYGKYVNSMTIGLAAGPTTANVSYKILKPATHPLDAFGRHRPYERVTASAPTGSYAGWNVGDEGITTANISTSTLEDDTKAWAAGQWSAASTGEQMYLYIKSGQNLGAARQQIQTNTATQLTLQSSTLISNIEDGVLYYIGSATDSRHVSCADCHNTHASTNNPEGELEAGDVAVTNSGAIYNTLASTGAYAQFWNNGEWNGHLVKLRMRDGLEQIRFVTGFIHDVTEIDGKHRGKFIISHPWAVPPSDPACVSASGSTREECESNGGTWAAEHYELFMGDKWNSCSNPSYTTPSACSGAGYQWVYQQGGRAGSGSTGVWGVDVTGWGSTPAGDTMTEAELSGLTWTKVENVFDKKAPYNYGGSAEARQASLCVRCHSYYSFKAAFPTTPSGHADGGNSPETDIVSDFNPNNVAHHAVYARGQNQPLTDGQQETAPPAPKFSGTFVDEIKTSGGGAGVFIATCDPVSGVAVDDTLNISSVGFSELIEGVGGTNETGYDCSPQTKTEFKFNKSLSVSGASFGDDMEVPATWTPPYGINPNWPVWSGTISSADTVTNTVTFSTDMPRTVLPGWFYIDVDVPSAGNWTFREVVSVDGPRKVTLKSTPSNTSGPAQLTSGLGNTFVPPYGPWSILRCSDCHGSTKTDPVGPHASVNTWLLKSMDKELKFEWYNGGSATSIQIINPRNDRAPVDGGGDTINYLCFNCHRRDVYLDMDGFPASPDLDNAHLSRQPHGEYMDENSNTKLVSKTLWPQHCRMCHGGDRMGAIHGSNAANAKRFLNGSSWGGSNNNTLTRGTTTTYGECYADNTATDPDESRVDNCSSHTTGGTFYINYATYDYDNP